MLNYRSKKVHFCYVRVGSKKCKIGEKRCVFAFLQLSRLFFHVWGNPGTLHYEVTVDLLNQKGQEENILLM
jgi:hypothetical protein